MRFTPLVSVLLGTTGLLGASPSPTVSPKAPTVSDFLKPKVLSRVVSEREIMTGATLEDCEGECEKNAPLRAKTAFFDEGKLRRYSFYAGMLIRSSSPHARAILTDYRLYPKMIHYVDVADYNPQTHILNIEGGVWKYRLSSRVRFEEIGDRWIRFEFVEGHFTGMKGDILLEPQGERGTVVVMRGEVFGRRWPPAFVLEQGAQIVFSFTANKMRSFIESQKTADDVLKPASGESAHDPKLPQPRRKL